MLRSFKIKPKNKSQFKFYTSFLCSVLCVFLWISVVANKCNQVRINTFVYRLFTVSVFKIIFELNLLKFNCEKSFLIMMRGRCNSVPVKCLMVKNIC